MSIRRNVRDSFLWCLAFVCGWLSTGSLNAQSGQTIYTDSLQNGWVDWSWATVNLGNASPARSGTSISVSAGGWEALYLHHADQSGSGFSNLTFWINGGIGGQLVRVYATRNDVQQTAVDLDPLPANSWRQEFVSLAALGVANASDFDGIWIQALSADNTPTFYVDDIALTSGSNPPPVFVTNPPISITIDATKNRRAIDPFIYGVAFASSNQLGQLNAPVNRSGGNAETRYNWRDNVRNHAADWYFESLEAGPNIPGEAGDSHVTETKQGGSEPMLTVPMIGWMPKLGPGRQRLSSYSIAKYGPQTGNDWQWFPDAGNGVGVSGQNTWLITTNDPNDAHFLTNSLFQQTWIRHLTNRWGLSTNGGVRFYCMDNEHTLWNSTHRDVHPIGTTMQEIRDKFHDYGDKVKDVDPNALLLAPEEWGWTGYFYSGFDAAWAAANGNWNPAAMPDRNANGGMDYMPWFLAQARQHELSTGRRLLDYFTLHIYPQGGEYGNDVSTAMQLRRNRSTRALWDTNYMDETWINSVVKLIPRMKDWVASHYPDTKIGITEYNWGAEDHINGATAQADIYGIFGREGLDLATRWTTPPSASPTFKAMQMYRNYDGSRSTFGDVSVSAASEANPDHVAVFAAERSADRALTIMAINKQLATNAAVVFAVTNHPLGGAAQVWQLTSANSIVRLSDVMISENSFSNTLPAQSVTLFVIVPVVAPVLRDVTAPSAASLRFLLQGASGQRYGIQASSDLLNWTFVQTNTLASNSVPITVGTTSGQHFFRAVAIP